MILKLKKAIARQHDEYPGHDVFIPWPGREQFTLAKFANPDTNEKDKQLRVSWSYKADQVNAHYRSVGNKYGSVPESPSIRFTVSTFNHDGWMLFGLNSRDEFGGPDMVLFHHRSGSSSESCRKLQF